MMRVCKERKLKVKEADVITYSRNIETNSLLAVTGFNIVEHLSFAALIELLDESLMILKPEGVCIFETPNPKNIIVGACNFYTNPTHKSPILPSTLK